MHEQPKNRKWVKNAAIIFLAVLLVLTFFSNTIMNRSLPEVATQDVTDGSIVARVRGTGKVTANSNAQVKMEKTRVIRSVLVKVGQQVEAGDVLFTLGEGSSEEIDAAEDKVRQLQANYDKMAVTIPDYSYGADYRRIDMYREAYEEAQNKVDDIMAKINAEANGESTNHNLQEAWDRLQAAQLLKNTAEEIYQQRINEKADALQEAKDRNEGQVADWEKQVAETQSQIDEITNAETEKSVLENEVVSLQSQIDDVQRLIDNYSTQEDPYLNQLSDLENQLSDLQAQLEAIEAQEESDQEEIDRLTGLIDDITEQIAQLQETISGLDPNSEERIALEQQIEELKNEQDRLSFNLQAIGMNDYNKEVINAQYTDITEQISNIENQASVVNQSKAELEEQLSALEQEKANREDRITSLTEYLATHSADEVTKLNEDLSTLLSQGATVSEIEELMHNLANVSEADLDSAVTYLNKCQAEYDSVLAVQNARYSDELKLAKEALRSAENVYITAQESLKDKINSNNNNLAGINVDLANTWQQLEKAKRQLADLTGDEEAQILARVSGTIQSISAAPGDTKKKDDVLAVIEAPDMGYNLSFSVTNDQAARLRVGDTATVSNFYWGAEITATLASIQIDQKNPQTNKLLTFDLSGNVTAGTDLTLSVGQKSANYDIIIPSSAIRTDTNGTFVLKVESKNSPLGNRYIARRVPVEVLASDDTNSAVSADLGYGDYVITTSSAPLKNGQLVRLAST